MSRVAESRASDRVRRIGRKLTGSPEKPAYVPTATHMLPTFSCFNLIPMLAAEMAVYGARLGMSIGEHRGGKVGKWVDEGGLLGWLGPPGHQSTIFRSVPYQ